MNAGHNRRTGIQPMASESRLEGDPPAPWAEFGKQVLAAHHRNGLGAQCICGSLMCYCPVIEAAERLGLPIDDPGASGTTNSEGSLTLEREEPPKVSYANPST